MFLGKKPVKPVVNHPSRGWVFRNQTTLIASSTAVTDSAALLALSCTEDDGDGYEGDPDPVCGDYGYGETTCEDVSDIIMRCSGDTELAAEDQSNWDFNCEHGDGFFEDNVLAYCSCDDCDDPEGAACDEWRACMCACDADMYVFYCD